MTILSSLKQTFIDRINKVEVRGALPLDTETMISKIKNALFSVAHAIKVRNDVDILDWPDKIDQKQNYVLQE